MLTQITPAVGLAAGLLKAGKVVAFPTETVFGLGALISRPEAVSELFSLKGRPTDNPLIVHIHDLAELDGLVTDLTPEILFLMEELWPGPITFILPKSQLVGDNITAGLSTIAIRQPAHPVALELIKLAGCPIAAPSANLSGRPSSTKAIHVLSDFDGKLECILDGETQIGLESTVLDCSQKPFCILREGAITHEKLITLLPSGFLKTYESPTTSSNDQTHEYLQRPKSPGMKYRHYSPKAKVVVLTALDELQAKYSQHNPSSCAFIGLRQTQSRQSTESTKHVQPLRKRILCENLEEYARQLFAFFRECDQEQIEIIFCEQPTNAGLGRALRERLEKAASV